MPTRAAAAAHRANLRQAEATTLIYHARLDGIAAELLDGLPDVKRVIRLGDADGPTGVTFPETVDYSAYFETQPSTPVSVSISEDDEAYVLFTSGSTGDPKGVVNSHFTWAHYSITAGLEIGDTRPGEIFAHGAPMTHFT
jgi:acyl-coenzyme A synthetase/AMP-(fatty) acid ligase